MGKRMVQAGVEGDPSASGTAAPQAGAGQRFVVSSGWTVLDGRTGRVVAGYIQHRWEAELIAETFEDHYRTGS